jgi:uncharacterized protein YjdB
MKTLILFKQIIILILTFTIISCEKSDDVTNEQEKENDKEKEFALLIENGGLAITPIETIKYSAILISKDGLTSDAGNITWSVTPESIASIDDNGNFTPKNIGEAQVTATINHNGNVYSSSVPVGVYQDIPFSVNPCAIVDWAGSGAVQLVVENITLEKNVTYTYESSDPSIASVTSDGKVNFINEGLCTIKITASNLPDYPFIVPVLVVLPFDIPLPVTQIKVNKKTIDLFKNETCQLVATAYNNEGKVDNVGFNWESMNPSIAEVSANGLVTPKSNGETRIKVTSESIFTYIDVLVNPDSVVLIDPIMKDMKQGESFQFTATCYKYERDVPLFEASTYDVKFKWEIITLFTDIGTVDNNGKVTINENAESGDIGYLIAYDESNDSIGSVAMIFIDSGLDFPGFKDQE